MSAPSNFCNASDSQVEVAGFAALSAGLGPPKRLAGFEPAGVPVAPGVVLPVTLEFVTLPNKLLPGAPEAVLFEPPVPELKVDPPVVTGLAAGGPNRDAKSTWTSNFKAESVSLLRTSSGSRVSASISEQTTLSCSRSRSTDVRTCMPE
jgi:hypothetical protein